MKKQLCAFLTAAAMLLNTTPASVLAIADISLSAGTVSAELKAGETVSVPVHADTNAGYAAGSVDLSWDNNALKLKSVKFTELAPDNGSPAITDKGSYRVSFGDYKAEENLTGTGVFFTLNFEITDAAIAGDYVILLDNAKMLNQDVKPVSASLHSGMITLTGDAPADAFTMSAAKTDVTVGETGDILVPVTAETNPGYVSGLVDILWDADALTLKKVEYTELAPDNGSADIVSDGSYRVSFGKYTAEKDFAGKGTLFTLVFTPKADSPAGEYAILLANPSLLNFNLKKVPVTVHAGAVLLKGQTTTTTTATTTTPTETTTTTGTTTTPTETTTTTGTTTTPTETTTTTGTTTTPTETTTTTGTTTTPTETTTTTGTTTTPTETTTTTGTTTTPTETTTTTDTTTTPTDMTTTTGTTTTPTETTTTTATTTTSTDMTTTTGTTTTPTETTTTTGTTTTSTGTTTTTTATTTTSTATTTTTTDTTTASTTPIKGDYNDDGEVTLADAVLLMRFIAEDSTLTDAQINRILNAEPDFDGDGIVTLLDVRALLKKL